ncbi:MAG: hybrid sensor histidine kinase/response regulator [Hyphomicrobium sp.]
MTTKDASGMVRDADELQDLKRRNEKLAKINSALMQRVERSMEHQANAYSMFQTAIGLEAQVRVRTDELKNALNRLERLNDQLMAARDAAERANRFKTRFFTSVGHDLLQPLHAARLSLSAMSEPGAGEPQSRRLVTQIDHALSTIEELLRTILDLSRLDAGAVKPSFATVSLKSLFSSLALDLQPMAQAKGLILTLRSREAVVKSDPLLLRRILQNLLSNAVQYTERGRILLAARRRGDDFRVDVWDTGPGIAYSEQDKIFEEFHRGVAAERSRAAGFGIGLAIISRTAEALGHRVELCSLVGKGTRFSVYAPAARDDGEGRVQAQVRSHSASQAYGLASTRTLVVENDHAVLDAMRLLLGRWECDARFALGLSGVEALISSEPEFKPDIVLADYHLDHDQSGLGAVARVRSVWGEETAAVVITADRSDEVASSVQAANCELLLKPLKPAELRALITHLLG